jgi:hypothetical protein
MALGYTDKGKGYLYSKGNWKPENLSSSKFHLGLAICNFKKVAFQDLDSPVVKQRH